MVPDYVLDSAADIEDKFKEHIVNINARVDLYIEKCRIKFMPNSLADAKSMMKDLKTTGDWHEGRNYRQAAKILGKNWLLSIFGWIGLLLWVVATSFRASWVPIESSQTITSEGSHFFNNEKCNKTTETMTILIGWRSRDIKIPPYTSQKQLDYNVLSKSSDRAQMFLNGSMGPERIVNFERGIPLSPPYKGGMTVSKVRK